MNVYMYIEIHYANTRIREFDFVYRHSDYRYRFIYRSTYLIYLSKNITLLDKFLIFEEADILSDVILIMWGQRLVYVYNENYYSLYRIDSNVWLMFLNFWILYIDEI